MPDTLRVGDVVLWRGGWGNEPPVPAKVEAIELCGPGSKYGKHVQECPWALAKAGRFDPGKHLVVSLDNGHWAYGEQLSPAEDEPKG